MLNFVLLNYSLYVTLTFDFSIFKLVHELDDTGNLPVNLVFSTAFYYRVRVRNWTDGRTDRQAQYAIRPRTREEVA